MYPCSSGRNPLSIIVFKFGKRTSLCISFNNFGDKIVYLFLLTLFHNDQKKYMFQVLYLKFEPSTSKRS